MITAAPKPKLGLVRVLERRIDSIRPSPENARLYRPVDPSDPDVRSLAESIRQHGIQEPIVITRDGWIVSGHRRHVAAQLSGLRMVPVRILPFEREADGDRFLMLLREHNRQRIKSLDEKLREEIVSADPEEAYQALIDHRRAQAVVDVDTIRLRGKKHRCEISAAKEPFLDAIMQILDRRRKFWPLSDRQIHYALLNHPPLIHASKPNSTYANTKQSYKALVDLLTRARLAGEVPMQAIADPTRPVTVWGVHADPQSFIRDQVDSFLKGYWRDLMQSQPNHVEIVGEKNTIGPIIREVAAQYCIPMTLGRGYCSLPPRYEIAERYRRSGKEKLVLLILSDFDPDGEEIAHSLARSMRDDFDVQEVVPIKVALTADQVEEFALPPLMTAKKTSTNYKRFVEKHGDDVFELEAIEPETLQTILAEAIDGVIDVDAFNHEVDAEKADAAFLQSVRYTVHSALEDLDFEDLATEAGD